MRPSCPARARLPRGAGRPPRRSCGGSR
jgi:hypothetical protein